MGRINKLSNQLEILKKYFSTDSEYDVSSYEDENQIVVECSSVTEEDKQILIDSEAYYDEEDELWFLG